jgi:hypothetical protein
MAALTQMRGMPQSELVIIETKNGLENGETTFGKESLNGNGGGVLKFSSCRGSDKPLERADGFAVETGKDGIKE